MIVSLDVGLEAIFSEFRAFAGFVCLIFSAIVWVTDTFAEPAHNSEQGAEQYLRNEDDCTQAVIGKVVIVDNEMQTDDGYDNLATIRRADLLEELAAPAL